MSAAIRPPSGGKPETRVFGLDVMRTVAVLLVVFGHFLQHARPPEAIKHFGRLGILGVEIFFVLSGFLIGGIIVKLLQKGRFSTPGDLAHFWMRRWMRTLPLYYLFFTIYLWWDWTGPSKVSDHWSFLVFMQNFAWRWPGPQDFFLLSWSLCVEEHFYLLFPLTLYLVHRRLKDPGRSLLAGVAIFLTVPVLIKLARAPYPDWDGFNYNMRMEVITRLDSLMYGVGAVCLKHYYPVLWNRLRRLTPVGAMACVAMAWWTYVDIPGLAGSRMLQTLYFPLASLSIALMLPWLDSLRSSAGRWWERSITFISTVSYSTYLGHILVLTIVNNCLSGWPGGVENVPWLLLYPIYFVFVVLLTPITYYAWERPFLLLRDRPRRAAPSAAVLPATS